MNKIVITNGRIIDPANFVNSEGSVYIAEGKIIQVGDELSDFSPDLIIDAEHCIVCPGFIDLSVRLREPGQSYKGTIQSETLAAAKAGVTSLCLPPDTSPTIDTQSVVEFIHDKSKKADYSQLLPIGALTKGLAGEELSSMAALKQAGCVAVSNASQPMPDLLVLRRAMEYACSHDLTIFFHPNDFSLSKGGCVHEGVFATRYGLPGIPIAAESVAVAQCLELAELTGCRLHFSQISSKRAAIQIQQAKKYGLNVTSDVAVHQLHITDNDIEPFNSFYHVLPPFRTAMDKSYLIEGLSNDIIDAICSDHQPHDLDAKLGAFPETEPGLSSLETLLPLTLSLVDKGFVSIDKAIALLTQKPADILGVSRGRLTEGLPADICVFDPESIWSVNQFNWCSSGRNTPFWDKELKGRVKQTLQDGRVIYSTSA